MNTTLPDKSKLYELDVVDHDVANRAWARFYAVVAGDTDIDPFDDKDDVIDITLKEYNGYNFEWDSSYIYFETKEDALAFVLKFA